MRLVEIYEGNLFECQMIKDLLENKGIESMLNHEIIGTRGGNNVFRPAGGVRVVVSDENYDQAKMVVKEFEKSR